MEITIIRKEWSVKTFFMTPAQIFDTRKGNLCYTHVCRTVREVPWMTQVTQAFVKDSLPVRDRNGHKGTFGKVHILAGAVGFTGAPAFAANSAVRTGSGLVFLSVPQEIWPVLAVKCNEAMPSPIPD